MNDRVTLHKCIHLGGTLHEEFMAKKFLKCMQVKLKRRINRIYTRLQKYKMLRNSEEWSCYEKFSFTIWNYGQ